MFSVFIKELVLNAQQQGSPFSFKVSSSFDGQCISSSYFVQPVVNPMLGPSQTTLINMGARFPPCMKEIDEVPPSTLFGCECDYLKSVFLLTRPRLEQHCQSS